MVDRYVAAHFLGLAAAGIFRFHWSSGNAAYLLASIAVIQVSFPTVVRAYHEEKIAAETLLLRQVRIKTLAVNAFLAANISIPLPILLERIGEPGLTSHLSLLWLILAAVFANLIADTLNMEIVCRRLNNHWAIINILGGRLMPFVSLYRTRRPHRSGTQRYCHSTYF